MGLKFSQPTSRPFAGPGFLSSFRHAPSRGRSFNPPLQSLHPSIFSTLRRPPAAKPNDFIPLFSDCVSAAAGRTQEYLGFMDPEDKLHPSPQTLTQIFLMTYVTQSVNLNLTEAFGCTAMTPQQRVLLGADWVWALLDKPTKTPRVQIAVQVLHLPGRTAAAEHSTAAATETRSESVRMAQQESGHRNVQERLVDFCSSVGKDCYALFLFFGRKNDKENIYGVLSNNFEAAIGKCSRIDRTLIENFFKGSRYLHTPSGMMQAVVTKKKDDPLTLMIKFS